MKIEKQLWEKVRGWYHYPPLRDPVVEQELDGGACFDFSSGDIRVGEQFVDEIKEKTKLSEEESLEGLLTHEVGHYMIFPRNLSTIILAGKMITDFNDDKSRQNFVFQTYADMCTDVASVLDGNKRDPILKMRTASQETLPSEVDQNVREVMLGYLHRQAGLQYNIRPELNSYLERMLTIEFLDPDTSRPPKDSQKMRLSLFQFGDIINDMINKYKSDSEGGSGGLDQEGLGMQNPGDLDLDKIIKDAPRGQIRRALREISEQISRGEYKQVRDWLKGKGGELPSEAYDGRVVTIGTSKGELQVNPEVVHYYRELSKQLPLIVSKKPIDTEKTKKAFEETEKWRVGREPLLAMPNHSGGLFLPGITRQVKVRDSKINTTDYDVPHLLVAIDSSGSMPDPADRKSHAVLAGYCAARSYHIHDSAVGVINFSGDSFYLPYTRSLEDALGAISSYQGGGTSVDVDILKKMLSPEEFKMYEEHPDMDIRRVPKEAIKKDVELSYPTFRKALESGNIDLLMFTDGGISNLDEVINYFEDTQALNRATIVLTDHYSQIIPPTENPNINVYRVNKDEDIPHIVLRDIRRNMNYHAARYETPRK
jgi:hypothetical protein